MVTSKEFMVMTILFQSNANFFLRFFERCIKENLNTEEDRIKLLVSMAKETNQCSIIQTSRSTSQIIKDFKKHYKKLHIFRHKRNDYG